MPGIHYRGHRYGIVTLTAITMLFFAHVPFLHAAETPEDNTVQTEEVTDEAAPVETERYFMPRAGYRYLDSSAKGFAASPYSKLKSDPIWGLSAGTLGSDLKLSVAATVINIDDYHAEIFFDGGGAYRFHLESEALWHNLLTEQLPPATAGLVTTKNLAPGTDYGIRFSTHGADAKVRLGNNPLHLSIGYWELNRKGNVQTIFSDFSSFDNSNTLLSTVSGKDQTTREGTLGIDGQFGSLGVAYAFRIRDFSDQSTVNRYNFASTAGGAATPGNQAISVTPDNQTTSHTIKLYSDMSGGLSGAAAYSYLQRKNNGGDGDARPSSVPRDTIHIASGDLRYTPFKELSFALKYRHQQIDRESPETITTAFATIPTTGTIPATMTSTPGVLLVHPSSDSIRDTLILSSAYQPDPSSQIRLEYRAELESRSELQNRLEPDDPAIREKDSRQTHTGKVTAFWKPLNGIKLTALYSYADCDNPAYSSSFSQQHTGQFIATLNRSKRWGATSSYLGRYETTDNNVVARDTESRLTLPRENLNTSLNTSIWFTPMSRLTVTSSYSYLENDSNQTVLFSRRFADSLAASNYKASAHIYGIDAVYALTEQVDLGASFQQVFSHSRFTVEAAQFTDAANTLYTTDGMSEITALDATETGFSARADWRMTSAYGFSLEYAFRNYDSGNNQLDGSTHSIMTLLTGHW